jgi:hypothetical protein
MKGDAMRKITLILICTALICSGATCNGDGKVGPTRTACKVVCGSNGVDSGWFVYEDYMGVLITQPGLAMDHIGGETGVMFWNNGLGGLEADTLEGIWIEDSGVTQAGGRLLAYGKRDWSDYPHRLSAAGRVYQKPNAVSCECSARFDFRTNGTAVVWAGADGCSTVPEWIRDPDSIDIENLTLSEWSSITEQCPDLPDNGFEYTVSLLQRSGGIGGGTVRTVGESFMAGNITSQDAVFSHSYPMMYSYTVKTATPANLSDSLFSALIKTNAAPGGTEVGVREIASNTESTVHILRTDYFIAQDTALYEPLIVDSSEPGPLAVYDRWSPADGVDPEDPNTFDGSVLDVYDPNFITDGLYDPERIVPCYIIPIYEENDYIEIQFNKGVDILVGSLSSWLSDDPLYDVNGDGIVNLMDYSFGATE